jgi:hypothetical protein
MRKSILFIAFTTLVACKSKIVKTAVPDVVKPSKERFEKVALKEVDSKKQNRAFDLGTRLLQTCNTSVFKVFTSEEATEKVRKNATVENISKTCKKILLRNGKFIALELKDITYDTVNKTYLFRYNILYEKKYFDRELFVTVNADNKVTAMSTKEVYKKPN